MTTTIFSKIIAKEIPATIVYEDELCLAFKDIAPVAPMHILVIPKSTEIPTLSEASKKHQDLLGHILLKCPQIAKTQGFESYRLVINNGKEAGQEVWHLHVHLLGGRAFSWPPG